MPRGNGIVVSSEARGVFKSCVLDPNASTTSLLPGSLMTPIAGEVITANGIFTYGLAGENANDILAAAGDAVPIGILMDDSKQGNTTGVAYAPGSVAEIYFPAPGEEMNILIVDETGTHEYYTACETLLIAAGSPNYGRFIYKSGSPQSIPFLALENLVDPATAQLLWCQYTGH